MYKYQLALVAKNSGSLIIYNGVLVQAAFLSFINHHDPSLAKELHDSSTRTPYSINRVTPFEEKKLRSRRRREYYFKEGNMAYFSVQIFSSSLHKRFLSFLEAAIPAEFTLGKLRFSLVKVGYSRFNPHLILEEFQGKGISEARVHFLTPSFFKQTKPPFIQLLPVPSSVFHSLIEHWNYFSEEQVPSGLENWVQSNVQVKWFTNLQTVRAPTSRETPLVGFIGDVTFKWDVQDSSLAQWVYMLLKYGEYANVGAKRSMGFGEIVVTTRNS